MSKYSDSLEVSFTIPDNVISYYTQPHRKYHGLAHIEYLMKVLSTWEYNPSELLTSVNPTLWESLMWAIFYHDSVYEVPDLHKTNESKSANLFIIDHMYCPNGPEIVQAILATKTHILGEDNNNELNRYMIDLDLWALGDIDEYAKNNELIRDEVGASEKEWIEGRGNWLEMFLQRDQIYYTERGILREKTARKILEDDLKDLRK